MTGIDDEDRTEQELREDTVEELLEANDAEDLQRMRREMRAELGATSDEREIKLLEYRLDILTDALDQVGRN